VYFFLYESSDLTLESVDQMYNDPACKPWNSRQWAPPGYENRTDLVEQGRAAHAGKPLADVEKKHLENAAEDSA
jgi:MFS transporter, SP family, sugar:H+ symporter